MSTVPYDWEKILNYFMSTRYLMTERKCEIISWVLYLMTEKILNYFMSTIPYDWGKMWNCFMSTAPYDWEKM